MTTKKRYEYIWEGGRMRVFEYDGRELCHEYRGYPVCEGHGILIVPCEGGYISREHPYRRKWISCFEAVKIPSAPIAPRWADCRIEGENINRKADRAIGKSVEHWEQIKLF